jgi:putative endonuclease
MERKHKTIRQRLGREGENQAAEFLMAKGYTLIARNYRYRHQELDLILEKDHCLVIVEVKSLQKPSLGPPELRISRTQQHNIIQATWSFLGANPQFNGFDVRFDVLIVDFTAFPVGITHYEGAFWES